MRKRTAKKVVKRGARGGRYRSATALRAQTTVNRASYAAKREMYKRMVKRPGKFEGEAPYVPYYWEARISSSSRRCGGGAR